jgi:iron complex outermembrane receptor protein
MYSYFKQFCIITTVILAMTPALHAQLQLSGEVTDAESGKPLQGAQVSLEGTTLGTTTAEDGSFRLYAPQLQPGTYQLQLSFLGYAELTRSFSFSRKGEDVEVSVELPPVTFTLTQVNVEGWSGPFISPELQKAAPFSFTTLQKPELEVRNLGQDVPFLLRYTPSAVATSDAGAGIGYTGLRIRGSDATRTNVTINGVPLNDAESQGTFWVNLPDFTTSVQELQVQRGVGLSTNGAGAFGAGVHMRTLKQKAKAYGQSSNSYGSFNTWRNNLEFGTGLLQNRFTIDGRLSRITSDGYIDRASAEMESWFLSTGWWGDNFSLQAMVFHGQEVTYQAWYGVPVQYADDDELRTFNPAGQKADGSFHDNQVDDYQQTHYQLHYQQDYAGDWSSHIGLHYTRGMGFFEEFQDKQLAAAAFSPEATFAFYGLEDIVIGGDTIRETDLIRRRWLDNHFYGAIYSLNYEGDDLRLTIGGAANNYEGGHFGELIWSEFASDSDQGYRYYDVEAQKTDINGYVRAQYSFSSQWEAFADLQYRHVRYEWEPLDASVQNLNTFNFFNPKLGLTYRWRPDVRAYASFALANREPGRFDFLDADPGQTPRAERLYDWEAGLEKRWRKSFININAYYMQYQDQLALTGEINQDALPIRVNIPESYRLGLELNGQVQAGEKWQFAGALALSQNKIGSFTEFIDNWDTFGQEQVEHENTDLAFSPPVVGHASVRYAFLDKAEHGLTAELMGKYVGRQYLDNTSRKAGSLDPYFFNDLQIRYVWRPGFVESISLNLLVRNLFDTQFSANGWIYRFRSGFDPRETDPYAQLEEGNTYNLTGLYPQAGRNFLLGLTIEL